MVLVFENLNYTHASIIATISTVVTLVNCYKFDNRFACIRN